MFGAGSDSSSDSTASKSSPYDQAVKSIKKAEKLEKKAKKDKAKKNYLTAFKKLEKAYLKDKNNPDILNYMGFTSRKLGNFVEAEKFYLKGLNLIGLRPNDYENKKIIELGDAYKKIFSSTNLHENVSKINGEYKDNILVKEVTNFILKDKKRPICLPLNKQ